LFQLYYDDKKQKVQEEQRKIHAAIRRMDEFKDFEFVEEKYQMYLTGIKVLVVPSAG
jgi:hypothetical protein